MGVKIKFSIHPLFFIFGLYFAFTGKVFSFLISTISALLHELAHAHESQKLGYMLKKVVLMPYGAVISGDLSGLKFADEVAIAFAGPIFNFLISVGFIAVWWLFPQTYAFTDVIVLTNMGLAFINLLPAYPLDGGRILFAIIAKKDEKRAIIICRIISCIITVIILGLFVLSIILGTANITILFFAIFILFGAFSRGKENKYIKFYSQFKKEKLTRGQEEKVLIFSTKSTVKDLLKKIKPDQLCLVKIMDDNGKVIKTYSPRQVLEILSTHPPYQNLSRLN